MERMSSSGVRLRTTTSAFIYHLRTLDDGASNGRDP
ncbi:hypothetical protein V1277_005286 [Bradyrhizobium sp. AZCC 1588]